MMEIRPLPRLAVFEAYVNAVEAEALDLHQYVEFDRVEVGVGTSAVEC